MKFNPYGGLPAQNMTPAVSRRLLAYHEGEGGYTLNLMQAKAGATAPAHSHPHRQVVYLIAGKGDFRCGDEVRTMLPGDVIMIDPDIPHTFDSFAEDTTWLEFFTPAREDYRPE